MKQRRIIVRLLLTVFLILPGGGFAVDALAQDEAVVSGVVVDDTGEPLIGAGVFIKDNATVGVTTDMDGAFRLNASPQSVLIVSFIGFATQEVAVYGSRAGFGVVLINTKKGDSDKLSVTYNDKVEDKLFWENFL